MFISRRIARPHPGKMDIVMERTARLVEILSRHGGKTRRSRVVAGAGAGEIHVYAQYDSMTAGTGANVAMMDDPEYKKLMADREADPAADIVGPEVFRSIWGTMDPADTVRMQRTYALQRSNMKAAIGLLEEIGTLVKNEPVSIMAGIPVLASRMDTMTVVYSFADMHAFGDGVDRIGMSPEFQDIVTRADDLGTLFESCVLRMIK
jgi:hypothetical protein